MAGKGKFIYVTGNDRILVKDSSYPYNPETDHAFNLSRFSTDDLLKLKAQIATALENRMDLDEVTEKNLENLQIRMRAEKDVVVAQVIRQTLDRIDVVKADLKRAETRLAMLQDEMKYRLKEAGQTEAKFAGLITATYKAETVFSVGEQGWEAVYNDIVDHVIKAREENANIADESMREVRNSAALVDAFAILQKRLTTTTLKEMLSQEQDLPGGIEAQNIQQIKIKRNK